jgi:hypothetical protein
MAKWVKPDSEFASGSSGRVTRNMNDQRKAADESAEDVGRQQRQANPRSRADKTVNRGGRG